MNSPTQLADKRREQMDSWFTDRANMNLQLTDDDDIKTLSSLMANSAQPKPETLKKLSREASAARFKSCCLQAVTSAANPFIPGLTLSIRLGAAVKLASEGERRTISDIQSSVDELLLEIFERLPQTVRGFEGGMKGCTDLFEPEFMGLNTESNGLKGPLDMILSEQRQLETFSKAPLVMDFLSANFTLGLPDLNDTEGVLRNDDSEGRKIVEENGLALDVVASTSSHPFSRALPSKVKKVLQLLQGSRDLPSLTFLPGAQFVAAGMLAAPTSYYKVPAMRMLLDFVVYVGMVAALSYFVLFHDITGSVSEVDDIVDHSFGPAERACALVFVSVSIFQTHPTENSLLWLWGTTLNFVLASLAQDASHQLGANCDCSEGRAHKSTLSSLFIAKFVSFLRLEYTGRGAK